MANISHQWLGTGLDYQETWDLQLRLLDGLLEGSQDNQILYLEHSPVYTIGRTRDQSSLGRFTCSTQWWLFGAAVTHHGPGQLVVTR